MKEKKILHYLDLSSLVSLVICAVLILVFQSKGSSSIFEYVVAFFIVALALLMAIYIIFIIKSLKKDNNEKESKELFELSKKEKIWISIKIGILFILFCDCIYIYATI